MKTAKQIWEKELQYDCGWSDAAIKAINEARKEVIEEIYQRALIGQFSMDKESITSLINELQ